MRATTHPNHHTLVYTTKHVQRKPLAAGDERHRRPEAPEERHVAAHRQGVHIVERLKSRARRFPLHLRKYLRL